MITTTITFNTEMTITLPTEREDDYYNNACEEVKKFTGKFSSKPFFPQITYDAKGKKSLVTFKWNDAQYQGEETGEERAKYLLGRMTYWFKHCKFFRKHQVNNIISSYTIKETVTEG